MKRFAFHFVMLFVVFGMIGQAEAAITSVLGPPSSAGVLPAIIAAPANALNSVRFNSGMEGFDEAQGVLTTAAHSIDGGGSIPAGNIVDSHMIFLNLQDGIGGNLTHVQVVWTFDGPVVGVMSDGGGNLEAASTFELGAPGTNYTVGPAGQVAPYPARGMEGGDSYLVAGNMITVNMGVSQPGDWIRVITAPDLDVLIDIKPASCPNPLNVKSKGVLPVAIVCTPDFDPALVDPDTVELEGVAPVDWEMKDSTQPAEDGGNCFEAVDEDGDGIPDPDDGCIDLVLYFDKQEIVAALGPVNDEDEPILTLTGSTFLGNAIMGEDEVVIVKRGKQPAPSKESTLTTRWGELKSE